MIRSERAGLLLLLVIVFVLSCTGPEEPLTVWSNVAETAFLVERYNYIHDADVRFRYVENLTERFTQERPEADVIIGRWVNTPPVNALMRRHGDYASNDMDLPPVDAGPYWIPLSFNLPAIAALPDTADQLTEFAVSLDDITALYTTDSPPIHFAPSADPRAVYTLHRVLGFVPSADDQGTPTWDEDQLQEAVAQIREWRAEHNGGLAAERTYIQRYLYERPLQQLEKDRISAVYFSSEELFTWQFFDEREIDFRWLSSPEGELYASENVVYGGIPSATDHVTGATEFLSWVTNRDTQGSIMRSKLEARIDSFGILEGFSFHESVNRRLGEEIYPELSGRIPHPQAITMSDTLPRYWDEAREDVVEPYLQDEAESGPLASQLSQWYRQRGD
ncbi:MAG: hypothetical protein ACOCYB_05245 [Alkalispirochaeta sp.]